MGNMTVQDLRVRDIARAAVATMSPDDLVDFDELVDAYADDPKAALRAGRARAEPTASASAVTMHALTVVAIAVACDLSSDLVKAGARQGWRTARPRLARIFPWRKRSTNPRLTDAIAPELLLDQVPEARTRAVETARRMGVPEETAVAVASAVINAWVAPR